MGAEGWIRCDMSEIKNLPCEGLILEPQYREYVWGGNRLVPGKSPVAEAWVIFANNRVSQGSQKGKTLAEIALEYGEQLLGARVMAQTGLRFPLLVKLLDCAQWLSLQVHPSDEQAIQLEGPEFFGKTEAWFILEAAQGAQIVAGVKPGITCDELTPAIGDKKILELVQFLTVKAGDTVMMRPGTIHALGPGLFLFEIQQTSDLTYRVYDWDRPQTKERPLHINKSVAVADPTSVGRAEPLPVLADGEFKLLCESPYFSLETVFMREQEVWQDTMGQSFHTLTAIEGQVEVVFGGNIQHLNSLESLVVPASCGKYLLRPSGKSRILKVHIG